VPLEDTAKSVSYRHLFEKVKAAAELGRPAMEKEMEALLNELRRDIEHLEDKARAEVSTFGKVILAGVFTYGGYRALKYLYKEEMKRKRPSTTQ